jgi:hypothetical protein
MTSEWILDQTDSERFPFLLTITGGGGVLHRLLVQDSWPAEGKNTFCLRPERHTKPWRIVANRERVPIKGLTRRGNILSVVLDRSVRKRCELLFTEKRYKSGSGSYEQIFWRTQDYFRQRPASIRTGSPSAPEAEIVIDSQERYPYKFESSRRGKLSAGDYAVCDCAGNVCGVVERKTFRDFLFSLSRINILHMALTELAAYPAAAMLVEAPFHYFLDPARLKPNRMRPATVEHLIMELYATHPGVHLVFLENRKIAQRWVASFLKRCLEARAERARAPAGPVAEEPGEYGAPRYAHPDAFIREVAHFTFDQLRTQFPDWSESSLRSLLTKHRRNGWIVCNGRGVKASWTKAQ